MTPLVQAAAILKAHARVRERYVLRYAYSQGPWARRMDVWLLSFFVVVAGVAWMVFRQLEALLMVIVIVPLLLHSIDKAFYEGHARIIETHKSLCDAHQSRKRAVRFFVFIEELKRAGSLPDVDEIKHMYPLILAECEVATNERYSNLPVMAFLIATVVAIVGGGASIPGAWESQVMPIFLVLLSGFLLLGGVLSDWMRPPKFHRSELLLFLRWLELAIDSDYKLEALSEEKKSSNSNTYLPPERP